MSIFVGKKKVRMRLISYITPRVSKRVLLLVAGVVWGFASCRVFLVFLQDIKLIPSPLPALLIGFAIYLPFFSFVFFKVLRKHCRRIINKSKEWNCIFSFFDLKSYLIMAFMITLGILSRHFLSLPPLFMASFFFGLSFSLFTSAFYYFYYTCRFRYAVQKFTEGAITQSDHK